MNLPKSLTVKAGAMIVEEVNETEENEYGVKAPVSAEQKASHAIVLISQCEVPEGATVYYNEYVPVRFKYKTEKYAVLEEEDVLFWIP